MQLRAKILCVCLLAASVVAAPVAAEAGTRAKRLASVKVSRCKHKLDDRTAAFYSRMRRVRGTHRMWMRFSLYERVGDAGYEKIDAPGLGVWRKSRRRVRRFGFRQRVADLAPGGAYRVKVSYRWYNADGKVIRRARRRSRACKQPGRLPNLRIAGVSARPRIGGLLYLVQVVNVGKGWAAPFGVSTAVDDTPLPNRTVEGLAAGESRTLRFEGPPCERGVEAQADATDAVRETSELDNLVMLPCSQLSARGRP